MISSGDIVYQLPAEEDRTLEETYYATPDQAPWM